MGTHCVVRAELLGLTKGGVHVKVSFTSVEIKAEDQKEREGDGEETFSIRNGCTLRFIGSFHCRRKSIPRRSRDPCETGFLS